MTPALRLPTPAIIPPLDPAFRPAVLADRVFREEVRASGEAVPLVFALERGEGQVSRHDSVAFAPGHPATAANLAYAERLLKFLLWARGGWRVWVAGPPRVAEFLAGEYAARGGRAFDASVIGQQVYERPLTFVACAAHEVPAATQSGQALGGHLDGCRIGFDLGASDLKVSAVVDGQAIFSEEIVWEPVGQQDPNYHYEKIAAAVTLARARMPRLDAIGGSSAGVYVNNRPMVASLFRGIPPGRYGEIRTMFLRMREQFGVPLEVINDGDVTALAGAMSIGDNGVLGIALGSSEAAGYVDPAGSVTGWLNELAFAPIDYRADAPVDEWSGDRGVGSMYLSQQCVFRLAPGVGIVLPERAEVTNAEKLTLVQRALEAGHEGARRIFETIGVYLGYALAHYAQFYDVKHALILGRVTTGTGGSLILEQARAVMHAQFPELACRMQIQLPDEKSRRVGQSIAAASLPALRRVGVDSR